MTVCNRDLPSIPAPRCGSAAPAGVATAVSVSPGQRAGEWRAPLGTGSICFAMLRCERPGSPQRTLTYASGCQAARACAWLATCPSAGGQLTTHLCRLPERDGSGMVGGPGRGGSRPGRGRGAWRLVIRDTTVVTCRRRPHRAPRRLDRRGRRSASSPSARPRRSIAAIRAPSAWTAAARRCSPGSSTATRISGSQWPAASRRTLGSRRRCASRRPCRRC